jgi:excisionase family DNA binding protein
MELLTVQEAARILRLSPITIRRYIASGKLTAVRVGRNVRITQRDIDQFATREPVQPRPEIGHELTDESPLWGLIGIIRDGPSDLAENHDKYLADAYGDLHDQ